MGFPNEHDSFLGYYGFVFDGKYVNEDVSPVEMILFNRRILISDVKIYSNHTTLLVASLVIPVTLTHQYPMNRSIILTFPQIASHHLILFAFFIQKVPPIYP